MKVTELFEAYTPPVKNPMLAFRSKGEKVVVGQKGYPVGGTKEWLKTFGATETDVSVALRYVRQSPEYRTLKNLDLSMKDASTERHEKNGSIVFAGVIDTPNSNGRPRARKIRFTIQANGKVDVDGALDSRGPMNVPKPRIVPGDAVQSIVKTMTQSMAVVTKNLVRRMEKAKAELKKFESGNTK